ncbi:UDP-N-acetylmuramoyl-L-alanyl-D-glutamate--2,6-diaminopimelate ligase [Candidatus Daviesbacteria bacterium]|nr:UDP-N-acetylmuramoyl-L-alanyl-D-glutamate--2,6-diaminopimelate ligase [Candidatus Daviesbacteria bacterium]
MNLIRKIAKKFLPQKIINIFYHLPKAFLANVVYGFPTRRLKVGGGLTVIGVTGTDGKTTTVNMIYQILKVAGKKVSMISTINAPGFHVTSPDPFAVQRLAKKAKVSGDKYLILEVTSHALDQYRFWGIKFDVGVVTNITHEHLDYHKTFENYLNVKTFLLKNVKFAIVNDNLREVLGKKSGKLITFGLDKGDFSQRQIRLNLKIFGDYNLENALAALACGFVLDIDRKIAQRALERFGGITGRMEEIKNNKGIKIFIDFAHTPNALLQALQALRPKTSGRLIAVFGSAGKRDVEKRSLMGEIAARQADIVVVTAEDPRGEIEQINVEITKGAKKMGLKEGINLFITHDRQKAISLVVNDLARKGDVVGIFGKGHETSMNLDGRKEIPWSDFEAVKKALNG